MRRLPCIHLLVVALACGCFNPGGATETTSGTTGGTSAADTSTGSAGPGTGTPTTGPSGTSTSDATSGGATSSGSTTTTATTDPGSTTGTDTTGATDVTGSTDTTGVSAETGSTDGTDGTESSGTTMSDEVVCGDGVVGEGEDCDDGNKVLKDGCSECERNAVFVFASNEMFTTAEISNPTMADALCGTLAKMGGKVPDVAKGSEFMAWISYDGSHAVDRLGNSTLPYRHTHEFFGLVAANAMDVVSIDNLDQSIRFNQHGLNITNDMQNCGDTVAWTGTDEFGLRTNNTCENWTSQEGTKTATTGSTQVVTAAWTFDKPCPCDAKRRIYCFEVRHEP